MQRLKDIVVGIDVGGPKKGFHAVALFGGQVLARKSALNATEMTEWCLLLGCTIVAVDAPCRCCLLYTSDAADE